MGSIQKYQERRSSLRSERESFVQHWSDISELLSPRLSRFFVTDRNRGDRRNQKIWNERATIAHRTLRSGMMTGVSNPATKWAIIQTPDPDLNKYKPVKIFLNELENRMLKLLIRSNYYTTVPMVYGDQGWAGTSAFSALEDEETLLRSYHHPVGSYYVSTDHRSVFNTFYRDFSMTAGQMASQFPKDRLSTATRKLAGDKAGEDKWVDVCQAIEPNPDYDPRKAQFGYYKKFKSCFFESSGDQDKTLKESGFDVFPAVITRWDTVGEDIYGSNCPGMEALGSVRQLQLREKRKSQLIDKAVSPAMVAPASLRNQRSSILSGGITYLDATGGNQKFEPAYMPRGDFYQWVLQDIASLEERISRVYFEDLFLMLVNNRRSNTTAREIAELHEEKLFQLGPVLMRQNDEHFDRLFDIEFSLMAKNRLLPKIPKELEKMELQIEYVSVLAQAMKMVGVSAIDRGVRFGREMFQVWPEVRNAINPYNAVSEYFSIIGAPPSILLDEGEFNEKMQAEQEAAAKAQQAAMMTEILPKAASSVKALADADMEGDNALSRMSGMMSGQQAA
ncbi:MAG: phage tail protein [Gammaproteobacteria bacterium]|nr:phage tail protein [Gammaproteobacteria bacterium]